MVLYNHTKEHIYALANYDEYRKLSIGFNQALWLTCKYDKPFDYEIYGVKDLRKDTKGDVLVDIIFHGLKEKDVVKLCVSVFKDYKRPTLPDREVFSVEYDGSFGSKETYSGQLDIPLIGIFHDDFIVYKNGIRMFENDIHMSCVVRLLPINDQKKLITKQHTIKIHNKAFVSIGGFLIPENMLEVYKRTYIGLCKEFRPLIME